MTQISPITATQFGNTAKLRHAFFTRPGGVSTGIYEGLNAGLGSDDDTDLVRKNRERMANWMGTTSALMATPYQVHSADIVVTDRAWSEDRPRADGIVTNKPGLAIGIVTADCGPVLFAETKAGIIGAAHAGWQGALNGVLENTIDTMEELGARRENITAVLGPMISQSNYEVGPNFPAPFTAQNAGSVKYFTPSTKANHHMFNLTQYVVDRLNAAGVAGSAVERCTYGEEKNFFSYRRTTHRMEPDYGRQLSAIMLSET